MIFRSFFISAWLLFIGAHVIAGFDPYEQRTVDSIHQIINNPATHDTTRADSYIALSEYLYTMQVDTLRSLGSKAADIANTTLEKEQDSLIIKFMYNILGSAYNNIGYVYLMEGENNEALRYYNLSKKYITLLKKYDDLAAYYLNIGYVHEKQGNIATAIESYHKSLKLQEKKGDKKGMANSLNNIGYIYNHQGDQENSLKYYHESLKIKKEINDQYGMGFSYNNIASIIDDQMVDKINKKETIDTVIQLKNSAIENYKQGYSMFETIGYQRGMAMVLNNIGKLHQSFGEHYNDTAKEKLHMDTALTYFNRALLIREEIDDKKGLTFSLASIAEIHLFKNNSVEALEKASASYKISKELGYPESIRNASNLLFRIYKELKQFEEALFYHESFISMRDSIKNEETQKAAIRQQTKYEFEKEQLLKEQKVKELARIEAVKVSRRNNLQYSIIFLIILLFFGVILGLGFIKVSPKIAEGLIFFAFLIFFEFLLVLSDPYIDSITGGAPVYKLLANALLAGLIFPAHAFFERLLKKRLSIIKEKNN